MDPVTHFLTGATLARSGLNRKAAYATLAMTLAAETPDLDVVWGLRGPVAGFQHHRGITHTFVGLPVEALVVLGTVYLIHRLRTRRPHRASAVTGQPDRPLTAAPVRWGVLYGFILLALLSHLLLDWTNNYGLRPFFPLNRHWYALSIVFIVDPLMLLLLLAALLAPPLFGLVAGEVGAQSAPFRGRGWAILALSGIVALWGVRYVQHAAALDAAETAPYGPAGAPVPPDQVLRVFASPSPFNPFLWHTVAETPDFFQLAAVDTRRSTVDTDPAHDIFFKPQLTPAALAAESSWLGRVYLDWSSWPLLTDLGPSAPPDAVPGSQIHTDEVIFRDLRFLYDVPTRDWRSNPPLGAQVYVDTATDDVGRIAAMYMNGRLQR